MNLGASATTSGIPETTLYMVHLRASQINGCSVCVDLHSRELEHARESSERIHTVAAGRETPYFSGAERAALALTEPPPVSPTAPTGCLTTSG
jgi:AhpD family alkylhydroperoxidase